MRHKFGGHVCALDTHEFRAYFQCGAVQHRDIYCGFGEISHFDQHYLLEFNTHIDSISQSYNFAFTFAWNYMDVFIMAISLGLSTRFQQINLRLARLMQTSVARTPFIHPSLWREVRLHYVQLCELLDSVDENLAALILLSCANNLYFICFQLLNIFK